MTVANHASYLTDQFAYNCKEFCAEASSLGLGVNETPPIIMLKTPKTGGEWAFQFSGPFYIGEGVNTEVGGWMYHGHGGLSIRIFND